MWERRSRHLCALAAAIAVTTACGGGEPTASTPGVRVARRVAPEGEAKELGLLARRAVPAVSGEPFDVVAAPPHAELLVSLAVSGEADAAPVEFAVRAERDGSWETVFSEVVAADGSWRDRRVDLAGRSADRFRFDARAAADAAPGQAWWGSIVFTEPARVEARPAASAILISIDTLGASYLSSFGGPPGISPHLDAFLASGHSFRRAIAPYGNTLVSHASLFSALAPNRHGLYPTNLRAHLPSLIGEIASRGHLTAAFTEGAYVRSAFGFAAGFDWYDDGAPIAEESAQGARETFAKAARWLEELGGDHPFFLFVHTYEVHSPYVPRDPAARAVAMSLAPDSGHHMPESEQLRRIVRHNAGRVPLSANELRHLAALHAGEIHYTDRMVDVFLRRLEELGLADDTLVVITSDHGEQFGEHGRVGHGESLHNRLLHVPLGFRWPGRIEPGVSEAPVGLVDVLPTLFELMDIPPSSGLDGRSLVPFLNGDAADAQYAVSELRSAAGACVRLKLPWNCELGRYAVQSARFKYRTSEQPPYEVLYDLSADPGETRDVSAEHPQEMARQRSWLERYREREQASAGTASERPSLDAVTREQLRALGYAN